MNSIDPTLAHPLDLAVRAGCELIYETDAETPVLACFKPRQGPTQLIRQESLEFEPLLVATEYEDNHENIIYRMVLKPGRNVLRYDSMVMVPSVREDALWEDGVTPPHLLPAPLVRYTLPSRYADSDKLLDFAWQQFGNVPHGLQRVQAICDWLHTNIEYRTGSGSPTISAHDVIGRRYGVCRDFAHTLVALCRTFNLPARYVCGFVPDIGYLDPGTPMDFHAYCEVYLGGRWQIFDARFNKPRTGRIRISSGYDAVNCAFTTIYGAARLTSFNVWSYQVDPNVVSISDPVDLSLRLCGTPEIKRPSSPAIAPAVSTAPDARTFVLQGCQ
jgi:transglutaminase-like putative cysteine protease